MSGSKSHRLQHSARHHAPRLGFNTLQAGWCKTEKEILTRHSNRSVYVLKSIGEKDKAAFFGQLYERKTVCSAFLCYSFRFVRLCLRATAALEQ